VFAAGVAGVTAAAVHFGAPPWRSHVLAGWEPRATRRMHRVMIVGAAALTLTLAVVVVEVASASVRAALAPAAAACACGGSAMAMFGVRQWRFAPVARVLDAAIVGGCTVSLLLGYLPLALDGSRWSLAIIGATVAVTSTVAWVPGRLAEAASARIPVADREPARRR